MPECGRHSILTTFPRIAAKDEGYSGYPRRQGDAFAEGQWISWVARAGCLEQFVPHDAALGVQQHNTQMELLDTGEIFADAPGKDYHARDIELALVSDILIIHSQIRCQVATRL